MERRRQNVDEPATWRGRLEGLVGTISYRSEARGVAVVPQGMLGSGAGRECGEEDRVYVREQRCQFHAWPVDMANESGNFFAVRRIGGNRTLECSRKFPIKGGGGGGDPNSEVFSRLASLEISLRGRAQYTNKYKDTTSPRCLFNVFVVIFACLFISHTFGEGWWRLPPANVFHDLVVIRESSSEEWGARGRISVVIDSVVLGWGAGD